MVIQNVKKFWYEKKLIKNVYALDTKKNFDIKNPKNFWYRKKNFHSGEHLARGFSKKRIVFFLLSFLQQNMLLFSIFMNSNRKKGPFSQFWNHGNAKFEIFARRAKTVTSSPSSTFQEFKFNLLVINDVFSSLPTAGLPFSGIFGPFKRANLQ